MKADSCRECNFFLEYRVEINAKACPNPRCIMYGKDPNYLDIPDFLRRSQEAKLKSHQRMEVDEYYIRMAILASKRGTCIRRQVGCVLVDKANRVLSVGYNGNPSGQPHCHSSPCQGASYPSGEGLDKCEAIHAEISAIGACRDIHAIHTAYVTNSPCIHCVNSLLATPCQNIYFAEDYPHPESIVRWTNAKRTWRKVDISG